MQSYYDEDNYPEYSRKNRKKKKYRLKKSRKKIIRRVIIIVVILCLICAGGYVAAKAYLTNQLSNFDYVSLKGEDLDIDPSVEDNLKGYLNIVLLGIDSREGENIDNCRSDAIMIISIDKKTSQVKMCSVLRDSYLDVENNGEEFMDKVTHAHAYGGPVNTIRALNRNLDMNISDYMRVNWQTVADVVEAVGGVKVNIKDYEINEMNKYIRDTYRNLKKKTSYIKRAGLQTLDGTQAVTYCRIRKVGNGDEERSDRMRRVVKQLVAKSKKMKISELIETANKVMPEIQTSISPGRMFDLMKKYQSYKLKNTKPWPYRYEGVILNGVWYDVPVTISKNVRLLHYVLFGDKTYKPTERVYTYSRQAASDSGYWQ